MSRTYLLVIMNVFIGTLGYAQYYPILWQKCLGGTNVEVAHQSVLALDGGIITVGYSNSNNGDVTGGKGQEDVWVINLDSNGNLVWQACYGGTQEDKGYSVLANRDSGYIVTGITRSNDSDVVGNHGLGDLWLFEIDGNGNLMRQKCFGGSEFDVGVSLSYTLDGGLLVLGTTYSSDGDVVINSMPGLNHLWILKLDSLWNIQWQNGRIVGGLPATDSGEPKVLIMPNGEYVMNTGYGATFAFYKTDSLANTILFRSWGGSDVEYCYGMDSISQQEFLLIGETRSTDGHVFGNHSNNSDLWIIKVDSSGNFLRQKCLGGTDWERGIAVKVISDNEYLLLGAAQSDDGDLTNITTRGVYDYWLITLDSNFIVKSQQRFGGYAEDYPTSLSRTDNGDVYLSGLTYSNSGDVSGNHGWSDYWIIKLRHPTEMEAAIEVLPVSGNCTLSDSEKVSVRIFNLGLSAFYQFPVSYSIDGTTSVTEIVQDTILPGDTLIYTFLTKADFSIPGIYTLESYIALTGDSCATNDTSTIDVTSIEVLNIPVNMGFEDHEDFSAWKQQDLDGDGFVGLSASLPHTGVYSYSVFRFTTIPTDNLLWTSCLSLIPVTNYFASCWIQEFDSLYPFYLEIYLNTQPDTNGALQLLNTVRASDNIFTQVAIPFNVPQPGNYYIGFRAIAHDSVLTSGAGLFLDDITIDINTSISSAHPSPNIFIHPNPFQHSIHISSTAVLNGNIRIFNALGAVVSTHPVKEILSMDLSHLSEGIYFVEYRDEQRSVVRKITKVN